MATANQNTVDFVQIREIRDNVVILKDHSLRLLVQVGSTNFDLKSTDEQGAIIKGFQDFLNSLDYPLQIVINSRKLDVKKYLEMIGGVVQETRNELLKVQGQEYIRFVSGLAELGNIMSKQFYIVVPYQAVDLGSVKRGLVDNIKGIFKPGSQPAAPPNMSETDLADYKTRLLQRADIVLSGLQAMGLQAEIIGAEQLTEVFSKLYNPQ